MCVYIYIYIYIYIYSTGRAWEAAGRLSGRRAGQPLRPLVDIV